MKARASQVSRLMTSPNKGELSKGGKTYVEEIWLKDNFNYKEVVSSKYMSKGINQESKAIDMLSELDNEFYFKNIARIETELLTGECDIDTGSKVIDIKCPWSVKTFFSSELTRDYEWQGRAYMYLYNREVFELTYVLLDADEQTILNEQHKVYWNYKRLNEDFEENDDLYTRYLKDTKQVRSNIELGDRLSSKYRVKRFSIYRDTKKEEMMLNQLKKASDYYKTITL